MKSYVLVLTGGVRFKCKAASLEEAKRRCTKLHGKKSVVGMYWYAFA